MPPDDDYLNRSSSKQRSREIAKRPVENHTGAAAPREKEQSADRKFELVRAAYEEVTANRWNNSDSQAYYDNGIGELPVEKVLSVVDSVARRTATRINSFNYFVKELVSVPDPRRRAWQKKQLQKIVHRIRDNSVGRWFQSN